MANTIKIDALTDEVMKCLNEYADLAASDLKTSVKKAGTLIKKDIQANAPKSTGAYSRSWSLKTVKDSSTSIEVVVYSRNRYQLAHLLEFGHAKRGGGRVSGKAHIAHAEASAITKLEQEIKRTLGG